MRLQIWEDKVGRFLQTTKEIFGADLAAVCSQDLEILMESMLFKDPRSLLLLFFPTENDMSNGLLVRGLALSSSVTTNVLPVMTWFDDNGQKHVTHCPDFLLKLSDARYCQVYSVICDNLAMIIPTWQHFSQLDSSISSVVIGLLKQVCVWYNPSWEFPQKADECRKYFNWAQEFEQVVLVDLKLEENGS